MRAVDGSTSWDLPLRHVGRHPDADLPSDAWPATIPAVATLLRSGLSLGGATVLVGENGSGKSTIVEGIAEAFGLNAEAGSQQARHTTRRSESPLGGALRLTRGPGASRWGYFLRAETMHGFFTYLEQNPSCSRSPVPEPVFHDMSHGESFLALLMTSRFSGAGLYVFDEPESALSFTNCLALLDVLRDLMATGRAQVLLATHSPVLAALPGARILQLDGEGMHDVAWGDLQLVDHWRRFLDSPQHYLDRPE